MTFGMPKGPTWLLHEGVCRYVICNVQHQGLCGGAVPISLGQDSPLLGDRPRISWVQLEQLYGVGELDGLLLGLFLHLHGPRVRL